VMFLLLTDVEFDEHDSLSLSELSLDSCPGVCGLHTISVS
jgi:hypothetical protein